MTGEQHTVEHARDLVVANFPAALLIAQQVSGKIISFVFAPLTHEILAVTPILHHVVSMRHLFLIGQAPPGQQRTTDAPRLHLRDIGIGNADKLEQHQGRNVVSEFSKKIGLALLDDCVDRLRHDLPDLRLDGSEPAYSEAALDKLADPGVIRRNARRESGISRKAALTHDTPCFLADWA